MQVPSRPTTALLCTVLLLLVSSHPAQAASRARFLGEQQEQQTQQGSASDAQLNAPTAEVRAGTTLTVGSGACEDCCASDRLSRPSTPCSAARLWCSPTSRLMMACLG